MTEYLRFLQSLSVSQQKVEIERLLLSQSDQEKLPKTILDHPTVAAFSKSLGFGPYWKHKPAEGSLLGEVGVPNFFGSQYVAPILLRYKYQACRSPAINLQEELFVEAFVYIAGNGDARIDDIRCSSNQAEVKAQRAEFRALARQDYLAYLRKLTPLGQRSAIYHLADEIWAYGHNPKLFITDSPLDTQLSAACADHRTKLGSGDGHDFDEHHLDEKQVGLVEFDGDRCTVPIDFEFFGYPPTPEERSIHLSDPERQEDLEEPFEMNYYVEVHVLARVTARTPIGPDDLGGDLSIEAAGFRFVPQIEYTTGKRSIVR